MLDCQLCAAVLPRGGAAGGPLAPSFICEYPENSAGLGLVSLAHHVVVGLPICEVGGLAGMGARQWQCLGHLPICEVGSTMNQLARDVLGEVPAEAEQVHQGYQQEGPLNQIPGGLEGKDLGPRRSSHQVPEGEVGLDLAVQEDPHHQLPQGEGGNATLAVRGCPHHQLQVQEEGRRGHADLAIDTVCYLCLCAVRSGINPALG